jgi:hypothetical protein
MDECKRHGMQCPLQLTITGADGDEATAWVHYDGGMSLCRDFDRRPVVLPVTITIGNEHGAVRCKLVAEYAQ